MGDLRIAFAAPTMPFVIGASGMDGRSSGSGGRRDELCEAQRRATLRAPFVNSSLFVETRDYARSSGSPNPNQGYHWGWNAESLFLIGNAMGEAALSLAYPPAVPPSSPPSQSPFSLAAVYLAQTHVIEVGEYVKDAFKLVGGRPALLKVQLTGSGPSPVVRAIVTAKTGEATLLVLTGPEFLPSLWNGKPGQVEHKKTPSPPRSPLNGCHTAWRSSSMPGLRASRGTSFSSERLPR